MATEQRPRHELDALSDATRRAILEMLGRTSLSAGEIAGRFPQQRPAISKHLTLLKQAGWIVERRERQRRIYSLRRDAITSAARWLDSLSLGQPSTRPATVPRDGRPQAPPVHATLVPEAPEPVPAERPTRVGAIDLEFD